MTRDHEELQLGRDLLFLLTVAIIFCLPVATLGMGAAILVPCLLASLVITWYLWIGHRLTGHLVNFSFRVARGANYEPHQLFENEVQRLLKKGQIPEAIQKCRAWLAYDGRSAEPVLRLSIYVEHQHDLARAIQELEMSVSRPFSAKEHVTLAVYLAELYRRAGREREIAPIFARLRSLHRASPEIQRLK